MPPARWCLAAALAVACGSAGRGAGPAVPDAMTDAPDAQPRTDAGDAKPPTEGGDVEESTDAAGDGPPNCDGPLAFADPIVEAGVRKAAGINDGPLTSQNVAAVTLLVARGAHSLGGLECVINLEVIAAIEGTIDDLSPLRGLSKLWEVNVGWNHIADLSPLNGHSALTVLLANDNVISSQDGLGLPPPHCSRLDVQRNPIADAAVKPFCDLGWFVAWGGQDAATSSCNLACL